MEHDYNANPDIMHMLRERLGDGIDDYTLPPPVFVAMRGQFLDADLDAGVLRARFPVLERYMNPYDTMQGGMIAAAVDNTIGPLSVLVAPPNVTRRLRMTYSRPVTLEMGHIVVRAELLERDERWLFFRAEVHGPEGQRLTRSRAKHWILE